MEQSVLGVNDSVFLGVEEKRILLLLDAVRLSIYQLCTAKKSDAKIKVKWKNKTYVKKHINSLKTPHRRAPPHQTFSTDPLVVTEITVLHLQVGQEHLRASHFSTHLT